MRLTIVYDGTVERPGPLADRGFSCLIETDNSPPGPPDTGASGRVLRHSLEQLGVELPDWVRLVAAAKTRTPE